MLPQILVFFTKAGAFVFGSGLAIVPFLQQGVVQRFGWLNEQQFLDAVAVAMIIPGRSSEGFAARQASNGWSSRTSERSRGN